MTCLLCGEPLAEGDSNVELVCPNGHRQSKELSFIEKVKARAGYYFYGEDLDDFGTVQAGNGVTIQFPKRQAGQDGWVLS